MEDDSRIVSVARDPAVNVVDIHYQVRRGGAWADKRHHEPTQDATQAFHDSMDALVPHVGGPYLIATGSQTRVRMLSVAYTYRAPKEDGTPDTRTVKLNACLPAAGFNSALPLKVPAQEPKGDLQAALAALDREAEAHVDGVVGQAQLGV